VASLHHNSHAGFFTSSVQMIYAFLENRQDVPSELSYLLSALVHSGPTGVQLTVLPPAPTSASRPPPMIPARGTGFPHKENRRECPCGATRYQPRNHGSSSWTPRANPRIRGSPSVEALGLSRRKTVGSGSGSSKADVAWDELEEVSMLKVNCMHLIIPGRAF